MQQNQFKNEYPIYTITLEKTTTTMQTVDAILETLRSKIETHPVATYVALFDHYNHTASLGSGTVASDILDAKNILFCFGQELPTAEMLAVRPRSIGIAEHKDDFVISFLKAPNPAANEAMVTWVSSLKDR